MNLPASEPKQSALWIPPILRTIATNGTGVGELVAAIEKHALHLRQSGEWGRREKARLEAELEGLITETLVEEFRAKVEAARYDQVVEQLVERNLSPWEAVKALIKRNKRDLNSPTSKRARRR
jgi:LAO/AO transport system kinase